MSNNEDDPRHISSCASGRSSNPACSEVDPSFGFHVEEGAEAQSASVGGLGTRQGEDEGEASLRDAGIRAASWWVSGVSAEVVRR